MANLKQTFGRRLKALREKEGRTQESLGEAVGVDYKHIGAIERGLRAPSFDLIERLAKVLKCPWHDFFLPLTGHAPDVEADVARELSSIDQHRRGTIARLLTEVLRAAKKLERT